MFMGPRNPLKRSRLTSFPNHHIMVFRLPSQLESLVPPPYDQRTQPPPWRGSIVVSGMRSSDRGSNQQIHVTAVETDGEKYAFCACRNTPLI